MVHVAPLGLWLHRCTKIQDTASIVGAWFPRPTGWGTQPLRIQFRFSLRHCVKFPPRITRTHVAPLGLWLLDMPPCYKHVAPLGLKAPVHQNSRHGIHRRGLVSKPSGLGDPTATVSTSCPLPSLSLRCFYCVSRKSPIKRIHPNIPKQPN